MCSVEAHGDVSQSTVGRVWMANGACLQIRFVWFEVKRHAPIMSRLALDVCDAVLLRVLLYGFRLGMLMKAIAR